MEVLTAPAKVVYCRPPLGGTSEGAARSVGIDPEREVIGTILFDLEDLTAEKGYFVTPFDQFFRKSIERFEVPFNEARISFPRSTNPPISFIWAGNGFEGTSLKLIAEKGEDDEDKYSVRYNRVLFRSHLQDFDQIDRENIGIEELVKIAKREPVAERIQFNLPGMEMELRQGYDGGVALKNSLRAYDRRSGYSRKLKFNSSSNFSSSLDNSLQNVDWDLGEKTPEEIVEIAGKFLAMYECFLKAEVFDREIEEVNRLIKDL